jgi:sugar lactone lactonase YvrE
MSARPEVLVSGLSMPECLRWHDGALWFSDMFARRVYRLVPGEDVAIHAQFEDIPGGIGFLPDGELVVALRRTRQLIAIGANRQQRRYADLSREPGDDLNDIVIDRDGRIYLGNNFRNRPPGNDTLLMLSAGRELRTVAEGLTRPNGIAIAQDAGTLATSSTPTHSVTAFSVHAEGSLGNRRAFSLPGEVAPDGICFDAQDALWAGSPATHEAIRMGANGALLTHISCGEKQCACVALGGSDRRTLFLATWLVSPKLPQHPRVEDHAETQGFIEAVRVEAPGAGWP